MSTRRVIDVLRRGQTVTGRGLLEAIQPDPRAIRAGRGIKVRRNVAGQTVISLKDAGRGGGGAATKAFGRIDSFVPAPLPYVWIYTLNEVKCVFYSTGPFGWNEQPSEANPNQFQAFNLSETHNTADGPLSNGIINPNLLPGTFDLQPIPVGSIVEVFVVGSESDNGFYFDRPNAVDGAC